MVLARNLIHWRNVDLVNPEWYSDGDVPPEDW